MAYFLKKTLNKKGIYLQIYESYYDPNRKGGAHRSVKPIGYVEDLISESIPDPIAYYKHQVEQMNQQRSHNNSMDKAVKISNDSPEKFLGFFLVKSIHDSLNVKPILDLLQLKTKFQFNVYDLLSSLIYARLVEPCSKQKTHDCVIPKLVNSPLFSTTQIYSGIEYLGSEYEKMIEAYNHEIDKRWKFDTKHCYFDCTNFYFEIDKESSLQKKGPSKENRKDPIVGLGLLLDANQIPISMKIYPGNQSEKPIIRETIQEVKDRYHITGRTIQIADKGLNCAENIITALKNKDGYIFSKSVKQLPEVERTWVLLNHDYKEVLDDSGQLLYKIKSWTDKFEYIITDSTGKKKKVLIKEKRVATYNPKLAEKQIYEINKMVDKAQKCINQSAKRAEFGDSSKYVTFSSSDKDGNEVNHKVIAKINQDAVEKSKACAGYNLLVTSETSLDSTEIYKAYHNLWRIEESFRMMKSYLDARPVYLQKENSIKGHFLVVYLAVLLTRILQIHVLKDAFSTDQLFRLFTDYKVVQISERRWLNVTQSSVLISTLATLTKLPVDNLYLSQLDINKMLNLKFKD